MEPPAVGMGVVALSGQRLGTVVEMAEGAFRVSLLRPAGIEMWLSSAVIFSVEGDTVTLICERDGLRRYRLEGL